MSTLSRATYKTTYSDSAGQFPTNTTRQITATRMRTFADDTIDSIVTKNDDYDYWLKVITASGTDTYTITPTVPAAYATDEKWLVKFTSSNTGACTLNRNSLGAKDLKTNSGGALSGGDIVAGGVYIVSYNGTYYQILNVVAGTGSVSGLTSPRIPYATSATTLGDSANLTWDNTNNAITLLATRIFTINRTYDDLFIGEGAGNFTISGGAGGNIGLGYNAMNALTNGDYNIAIGYDAGGAITTGDYNVAIGQSSLTTVATGVANIAIGRRALEIIEGDNNVVIGLNAARLQTLGNDNICIGSNTSLDSLTGNNQINIGGVIKGSRATNDDYIYIRTEDTGTNTTRYPLRVRRTSSGTPAAGIGVGINFEVETAAGNDETGATVEAVTTDVTSTSEDFDFVVKTMTAGAAATEAVRFTSEKVTQIPIGTSPSGAATNSIKIFAKDSSDGSANATLGLYLEQAPEATATFTQSHRLKVWINGTEYWISLDAV